MLIIDLGNQQRGSSMIKSVDVFNLKIGLAVRCLYEVLFGFSWIKRSLRRAAASPKNNQNAVCQCATN